MDPHIYKINMLHQTAYKIPEQWGSPSLYTAGKYIPMTKCFHVNAFPNFDSFPWNWLLVLFHILMFFFGVENAIHLFIYFFPSLLSSRCVTITLGILGVVVASQLESTRFREATWCYVFNLLEFYRGKKLGDQIFKNKLIEQTYITPLIPEYICMAANFSDGWKHCNVTDKMTLHKIIHMG